MRLSDVLAEVETLRAKLDELDKALGLEQAELAYKMLADDLEQAELACQVLAGELEAEREARQAAEREKLEATRRQWNTHRAEKAKLERQLAGEREANTFLIRASFTVRDYTGDKPHRAEGLDEIVRTWLRTYQDPRWLVVELRLRDPYPARDRGETL